MDDGSIRGVVVRSKWVTRETRRMLLGMEEASKTWDPQGVHVECGSTGAMKLVVMGAGDPGGHWGTMQNRMGQGLHPGSFPPLPEAFPACSASQKALSLPPISPAPLEDSFSPRGPQPLVCLLRQGRGHVFANFVAAFIKRDSRALYPR